MWRVMVQSYHAYCHPGCLCVCALVVISFELHLVCETEIACYCFDSVKRIFVLFRFGLLIGTQTITSSVYR